MEDNSEKTFWKKKKYIYFCTFSFADASGPKITNFAFKEQHFILTFSYSHLKIHNNNKCSVKIKKNIQSKSPE